VPETYGMSLTPADIIEALVDELAMGELGERFAEFRIERAAPGELLLDYGDGGRFRLHVAEAKA
jgi:hypothetical protein